MKAYVIKFSDDLAYIDTVIADSYYDMYHLLYGIDRSKIYYDLDQALEKVAMLNN